MKSLNNGVAGLVSYVYSSINFTWGNDLARRVENILSVSNPHQICPEIKVISRSKIQSCGTAVCYGAVTKLDKFGGGVWLKADFGT